MSSTNTLSIALSPFLPLSAFSFPASGQCRLLSVEAVYHSLIGSAGKTRKTINNGRAICKQRQVSPTETRTNSGRSTKPSNSTAVRPINKIMAKIIEIFSVNVLTSVCPGLARIRHQLHTSSGLLLVAGGKGVNCINGGSLWRCSPPTVASQTEGAGGWSAGGHRV